MIFRAIDKLMQKVMDLVLWVVETIQDLVIWCYDKVKRLVIWVLAKLGIDICKCDK